MIQRIQSIYLLLVVVLSIVLAQIDLVYFSAETSLGSDPVLVDYNSTEMGDENVGMNQPLAYLLYATALIALIAIFLFNNRKLQIKVAMGSIMFSVVVLILMYFYSFGMDYTAEGGSQSLHVGALPPIALMLFSLLAVRAIQKDEALIRSVDRLR